MPQRPEREIPTTDLLRALVDLEKGPWARWWTADVEKAERLDGPPPRKAGAALSHKLNPFHNKLTRLDDARPLELLEVPPEPVDRLERLERELGRFGGAG